MLNGYVVPTKAVIAGLALNATRPVYGMSWPRGPESSLRQSHGGSNHPARTHFR
jgi:hypothetical protein